MQYDKYNNQSLRVKLNTECDQYNAQVKSLAQSVLQLIHEADYNVCTHTSPPTRNTIKHTQTVSPTR